MCIRDRYYISRFSPCFGESYFILWLFISKCLREGKTCRHSKFLSIELIYLSGYSAILNSTILSLTFVTWVSLSVLILLVLPCRYCFVSLNVKVLASCQFSNTRILINTALALETLFHHVNRRMSFSNIFNPGLSRSRARSLELQLKLVSSLYFSLWL